ncbi:hypothetical protein IWW36_002331 [Coemansia brasiliensis]|uniref:Uncharacterized protein n=1 Tax=Coemansia brasiliensis TaxID=2650707 RepID=A0A9W8IG33_9FUNG|nr:hypothetical protein IWW36_002331 [Coemansia brasiliensis]
MTERVSTRAAIAPSERDVLLSGSDDDEDEVFFGPMSTVELHKMHKQRDIHRRSTQVLNLAPLEPASTEKTTPLEHSVLKIQARWRGVLARQQMKQITGTAIQCATPEPSPLPFSAKNNNRAQAAKKIQQLGRGYLARRRLQQQRNDMQLLAMKGSISVERRRRMFRVAPPALTSAIPQAMPSATANAGLSVAEPRRGFSEQRAALPSSLKQPSRIPPPPRISVSCNEPPLLSRPAIASATVKSNGASNLKSPLRRGLSIRNWFQRSPAEETFMPTISDRLADPAAGSPSRSNTLKVNTPPCPPPYDTLRQPDKPPQSSSGRTRRYFSRLLSTLKRPKATTSTTVASAHTGPKAPSFVLAANDEASISQLRPYSLWSGEKGFQKLMQRDRRRSQRHRRGRSQVVGEPSSRRNMRSSGSFVRRTIPNSHATSLPIHRLLPTTNSHSKHPSAPCFDDVDASHVLLVPIESTLPSSSYKTDKICIRQQQESVRSKLRSPPFRAPHVRSDSSTSSISRPSPSGSSTSLEKQAGGAKKLAMIKTSIGSFLARPLSPRVTPPMQPNIEEKEEERNVQQRNQQQQMPRKIHAPSPLSATTPRPAMISRNQSVDSLTNSNFTQRQNQQYQQQYQSKLHAKIQSGVMLTQMPLSAVGGSFGFDDKRELRRAPAANSDTDEDMGIAASVSRLAVPAAEQQDEEPVDAGDTSSVTSISSMSVSSLRTDSSSLASDISMISAASASASSNAMDISPNLSICSDRDQQQMPFVPLPSLGNEASLHPSIEPVSEKQQIASPRLSLRLSADASSFGTGLSAFASLLQGTGMLNVDSVMAISPGGDKAEAIDTESDQNGKGGDEAAMQSTDSSTAVDNADSEGSGLVQGNDQSGDSGEGSEPVHSEKPHAGSEEKEAAQDQEQPADAVDSACSQSPQQQQNEDEQQSLEARDTAAEPPESVLEPLPEAAAAENQPMLERLRSLRSRRLRDREAPSSASKKPQALAAKAEENEASSGRRFRATQSVGQQRGGKNGKRKDAGTLAAMGSLQLDRLTKLNTRRNSTYMTCEIERVVVVKQGERPPSPSMLMQEKAQERRIMAELDGYSVHSIYSSSDDDDDDDACEDSDDTAMSDLDVQMDVVTRPITPPEQDEDAVLASASASDLPAAVQSVSASGPLLSSSSSSSLPGLPEVKRKSIEASAPAANGNTLEDANDNSNKKQCCRPRHVRWGTRSELQAKWLLGRKPTEASATKPILIRPTEPADDDSTLQKAPPPKGIKTRRQSRNLSVVKVTCFEYPDSSTNLIESDEDSSDEEFIPRRSTRSK